jgi:hypothetical protein
MDNDEIAHEPYMGKKNNQIWATVHSGGLKFFGRITRTTPGEEGAIWVREQFEKGRTTFELNPCFEYQIVEVGLDANGEVLSAEAIARNPGLVKGLGRNPKFTPFDFTTGPLLLRIDSLQIGNLLDEKGRKTYERMIHRAMRQHQLTQANDANLTIATSMADVKRVLGS